MSHWLRRPLAACALLLAVYVALSFANDPHGYLGTDTGGKVASLRAMDRNGHLNPDVGYWAQRWDPQGRVHPLFLGQRIDGKWINLTTVPMADAALPLYRLGGYRLALLLPMLGSVLAALAASAILARLGASDAVAAAGFWLIGLASPLTIYALDFWEHSVGVALMAWAGVVMLDHLAEAEGPRWWRPAAAGFLFGVAATMRTEALVYGVVIVGGGCAVSLLRNRRLARTLVAGGLALVGLIIPLGLNLALERATVGAPIRSGRAVSAVQSAANGATSAAVPSRPREALTTTLALDPGLGNKEALVGLGLLVLIGVVWLRARRSSPDADRLSAVVAVAGLGLLYLTRVADGLGFVPGLFAAAPLAGLGLVGAWSAARPRQVAAVALATMPLVWALQYRGGAVPQWGGRYMLTSSVLLIVAGIWALPQLRRWAQVSLVALSVAVTAFGVSWLSLRSHSLARATRALNAQPEPVMVSTIAHLVREGGAYSGVAGDRRWLTAGRPGDLTVAVGVVRSAGFDSFGLVELDTNDKPREIDGFRAGSVAKVDLLEGIRLRVVDYERT